MEGESSSSKIKIRVDVVLAVVLAPVHHRVPALVPVPVVALVLALDPAARAAVVQRGLEAKAVAVPNLVVDAPSPKASPVHVLRGSLDQSRGPATSLWIGPRASHTHVRQGNLSRSPGLVTSRWIGIVRYLATSLLNALHRNSRGASQGRDLILGPVHDQYLAADPSVVVLVEMIGMKMRKWIMDIGQVPIIAIKQLLLRVFPSFLTPLSSRHRCPLP